MQEMIRKFIEERTKVVNQDYIDWLVKFIQKVDNFTDDIDSLPFDVYSFKDKEMICDVSILFSQILEYYVKNNIEVEELPCDFDTLVVSVNLTEDVAVEFIACIGLGEQVILDVSLVDAGKGKVAIKDVLKLFE